MLGYKHWRSDADNGPRVVTAVDGVWVSSMWDPKCRIGGSVRLSITGYSRDYKQRSTGRWAAVDQLLEKAPSNR
jgi:hypothetical protein